MIKTIAKKEITIALRNWSYLVGYAIVLILMTAALTGGYQTYKKQNEERLSAAREQRQKWLNQDPKHPHIAAHFGNYAFMPKTVLSLFDYGLDSFTGTVVYLEPHRQNDFSFKPAEEQNAALRFGELSLALILQFVLPLLVIFLCFSSFSIEAEQGTLGLLYAQGLSFKSLFRGKFLGFSALMFFLLVPALLLCLITEAFLIKTSIAVYARTFYVFVAYTLYLLLFVALSLLVSAYSKNSKLAMLILLGLWIINFILIPKWAVNTGDNLYSLPSKYEFSAAIHADINKGINGHDPKSIRAIQIKKRLLQQYHVDTISRLPFNFDGYIMQAGEDYSSRVYDKHFAELQLLLNKQNKISQLCSFIDPFIAIRNISMGLSGTDYYTHLDFQKQAEDYRRTFVQQMNHNMQEHSRMGDWDYKVGRKTFEEVKAFSYSPPTIYQSVRPYLTGFISLLTWFLIIAVLIRNYNPYLK